MQLVERRVALLLLPIVLAGAFLRIVKIDRFPPGVYGDEAAIGYNAYSILKTGKDEYGTRLPLQFKSFNDYKAPLAIYLTVPFVKFLGLTTQAIRLPSALAGVVTIITTFWLTRRLFKSDLAGLLAALFLAISPWHIHVSRAMFESNISLAFFLLGVGLFIGTSQAKGKVLAAVFLGLSLYAYHPAKLLAPIMALLLLAFFPVSRKKKLVFTAVFGLVSVPFLWNFLFGRGEAKFQETVIFRTAYVQGEIARRVDEQRGLSELPDRFKPLLYNKPLELGKELLQNYLKSFGTEYWYLFGEANQTLNPGPLGMFYVWEWPLFYLGLYFLFSRYRQPGYFIGLWLLLAPLPAALTGTTYVLRHLLLLPWPQVVEAYGLAIAANWLIKEKRLLFWALAPIASLMILAAFLNFYGYYYYTYGKKNASWWGYNEKEMIRLTQLNYNEYNLFFLQDTASVPVTYAFYTRLEPKDFQASVEQEFSFGDQTNNVRIRGRRFGKVIVGSLLTELKDNSPLPNGSVLFLLPEQASQSSSLFTINDPADGRPIFKGYIIGKEYQRKWRFN